MPDDELRFIQPNDVEFVGPFEETRVIVQGRQVPFLTAEIDAEGSTFLHLDNRMCVQLPPVDPDRPYEHIVLIEFIADCIAAGMGYTAFPRDHENDVGPVLRPPFSKMISVGVTEDETDTDA